MNEGLFGVILFDEGKMLYQPSSFLRENVLGDIHSLSGEISNPSDANNEDDDDDDDRLENQIERG